MDEDEITFCFCNFAGTFNFNLIKRNVDASAASLNVSFRFFSTLIFQYGVVPSHAILMRFSYPIFAFHFVFSERKPVNKFNY